MSSDRDGRKWPPSPPSRLARASGRSPAVPRPPRTMDIEPVDRARWTELAHGFADYNYRQCWDFGVHAALRVGAKSEHVALRQAGEVVAIADVRVRELPVLGGGLAFVTGGPLTRNDRRFDPARYVDAVAALRRRYVEERGCVLRILAPVGPPEWNDALNAGLTRAGFESTNAARPHRTLLLPVGGDLAEIRMRFHKQWRRNLRDSEREHIEVRVGSDTEFLDRFAPLFEELVVRKGFDAGAYDAEFFQRVQRELPTHERYVVLLAVREGRLLAGRVTSMLGDTCVSLLSASSPEALECKASYLIQWRTIEAARECGCVSYDQGGINPEGNPGVYQFKAGFGGTDVRAAGPLQAVGGIRGKMTLALEALIANPGNGALFGTMELPVRYRDVPPQSYGGIGRAIKAVCDVCSAKTMWPARDAPPCSTTLAKPFVHGVHGRINAGLWYRARAAVSLILDGHDEGSRRP